MQLILQTQLRAECMAQLFATPAQVRAALPLHTPDEGGRWWLMDAQGRKAMLWCQQPGEWFAVGNTALIQQTFAPARPAAAVVNKVLSFFR